MDTILKTLQKEVLIGPDKPFVIIGEKINPSGVKSLAQALVDQNMEFIQQLAMRQVAWGADMLDINVGHPQVDEVEIIAQVVKAVQSVLDVPLCIDSNKARVLEAGLKIAAGKPLVNSVSGEEKQLSGILPIVKQRGAAVIGLTIDEDGIPATAEGRLAIAGRIIERAVKLGIAIEDILIDPLVMPIKYDSGAAMMTIKAIELIKKEYAVNISLGASNISFGMQARHAINAAFLTQAMEVGATCSITDPIKLGGIIHATDLLLGRDPNAMRYLGYFRRTGNLREQEAAAQD
jgi:5-methyltetrahydrofolate--homocysteine methyltransferase